LTDANMNRHDIANQYRAEAMMILLPSLALAKSSPFGMSQQQAASLYESVLPLMEKAWEAERRKPKGETR